MCLGLSQACQNDVWDLELWRLKSIYMEDVWYMKMTYDLMFWN